MIIYLIRFTLAVIFFSIHICAYIIVNCWNLLFAIEYLEWIDFSVDTIGETNNLFTFCEEGEWKSIFHWALKIKK